MSRNFELLQRAGLHKELFGVSEIEAPATPTPKAEPTEDVFNSGSLYGVDGESREDDSRHTASQEDTKFEEIPLDEPPDPDNDASVEFPSDFEEVPSAPSSFFPPDRAGREEATKLVRRLFLTQRVDNPRLVVMTGAHEGVGCSWVCALTSQVLAAQVRRRVCIVDANLHAPSLHKYFRVKNQSGLSDSILRGEAASQCATQIQGSNLWLLPAGQALPHFTSLASLHSLHSWMAELRRHFDYIIVDSPPVNSYADAIILGQGSDGMILVVEYSRTPKDAALQAKQSVESANIPLLGAVLNKRTLTIPKALHRFFR
jgi:capsular exopolysaccharide synthesis family protein